MAQLKDKVKTTLDEGRILVIGAQVLYSRCSSSTVSGLASPFIEDERARGRKTADAG